jgi:hypothetical protein
MPRLLARLRRTRKRAAAPEPSPARGLGDPSSPAVGADDAELDSLRGELVRELDRMAEGHGGSATVRRC